MNYKTFLFHHFINTLENVTTTKYGLSFHAQSINTDNNAKLVLDNLIILDSIFHLKTNKYMPKKTTSTILIRMCKDMEMDVSNKSCYVKVDDRRTTYVKWDIKYNRQPDLSADYI